MTKYIHIEYWLRQSLLVFGILYIAQELHWAAGVLVFIS